MTAERRAPVELHYRLDGAPNAPPLVLSNSLGTTLAMWEPQIAPFGSEFRVVRYDHRGHGGSPVPPGPYAIEDLGRDLLALLDRLEIARTHLCGLSLGGMVGMWVAAHAPERVDRLVLISTSARLDSPGAFTERAALVRTSGIEPLADGSIGRWFTSGFAARSPAVVAETRAMLVSTPSEGYAGCCEAVDRLDLRPDLPRISAPTLVVAGSEDRAIVPEHAQRIADAIPGARLVLLADAAHIVNLEQSEVVARLILEHLRGPEPD